MDRDKALDVALGQIKKQYGDGAIMRMGAESAQRIAVIPTGSIALDVALGVGGFPRGRVVEVYGPESSGKCLAAGTYLWTDHGLETIEELFARVGQKTSCTSRVTDVSGLGVRMVNEDGELEGLAAVTHNNRRPTWEVVLESGRRVQATANHPLRVLGDRGEVVWRTVAALRKDDVMVSALFGAQVAHGGNDLDEDQALLLGYLVAEGTLDQRGSFSFTSHDDAEVVHDYLSLVERVLGVPRERVGTNGTGDHRIHDAAVRTRLAQEFGLDYVGAPAKSVPRAVRTGGAKAQSAFLSALYECDGWIEAGSEIGLGSASRTLAEQVQLLLLGLGIPSSMSSDTLDPDHWTVRVPPAAAERFLSLIGFRSQRRAAQVAAVHHATDPATAPWEGGHVPAPYTYERVVAIEPCGEQPTFDVVVPRTHSFLANGILSHNTTIALHAIAEAQAAGGIAAFIDAEHALDPTYAAGIGVDVEQLLVSQPDTGEQALEIVDTLVRSGAIDLIVVDSVAALTPRAEIEGEMGDSHVGLQARLMSQALRKLAGHLNRSRTCCIFINQLREKVGVMFGSPETTPGGRALKFYASVRLDIRRVESLKDGQDFVGNRVRVKVVKNKVAPPFKKAEMDILFGEGISREGSLLDLGVEHGLIRKSGAWFSYDDEQLGQGRENARQFLQEHADVANAIYKKIAEQLGMVPTDLVGDEPVEALEG